MIRIVSWNIARKWEPWRELVSMAQQGAVDVALLQEAGNPPPDLGHPVRYGAEEFWKGQLHEGRPLYDRWPLVVQLSDRVNVEWFRAVPPISHLGEHDIAISGIGTIAAARVMPRDQSLDDAFIAVSMYARYMSSSVDSHSLAGRRLRRVCPPHPLGPLGLHRPRGSVEASHSCDRRSEHDLWRDGQNPGSARAREGGLGPDGGTWPGIPGSSGSGWIATANATTRCAVRHEERADMGAIRPQSGRGRPPVRLCHRVARVP